MDEGITHPAGVAHAPPMLAGEFHPTPFFNHRFCVDMKRGACARTLAHLHHANDARVAEVHERADFA